MMRCYSSVFVHPASAFSGDGVLVGDRGGRNHEYLWVYVFVSNSLGSLHKSWCKLIRVGEVLPKLNSAFTSSVSETVGAEDIAVSELAVGDDVRLSGIVKLESSEISPEDIITIITIPRVGSRATLEVDGSVSGTTVDEHLVDPHLSENVGGKSNIVNFKTNDLFSVSPILNTSVGQKDLGIFKSQPKQHISGISAPLIYW